MPRLPGVGQREAVRALRKAGFEIVRQGKHITMSDGTRMVQIPRHTSINSFTMGKIAKDAGSIHQRDPPSTTSICICSFITPKRELRQLASDIVGPEHFNAIYTRASYETCALRSPTSALRLPTSARSAPPVSLIPYPRRRRFRLSFQLSRFRSPRFACWS